MIEAIDITKMIPAELEAFPMVVKSIIPDIAETARTEIIRLAGERLGVSSDDYIQGVQPVKYHFPSGRIPDGEHTVATIELAGWLPNAIEHGWAGGDMKPALLAGRNAKTGKSGRYNVVSFRHGVPGGSSRHFQKMGQAHVRAGVMSEAQGRKLGRSVHKAAKGLGPGERLAGGHSPLLRPHHKTDIHQGMARQVKVYKVAQQAQYRTFRAVSERSSGWIHPGIEARQLFREVKPYVAKVAGQLLQQAVRGMGRGTK